MNVLVDRNICTRPCITAHAQYTLIGCWLCITAHEQTEFLDITIYLVSRKEHRPLCLAVSVPVPVLPVALYVILILIKYVKKEIGEVKQRRIFYYFEP